MQANIERAGDGPPTPDPEAAAVPAPRQPGDEVAGEGAVAVAAEESPNGTATADAETEPAGEAGADTEADAVAEKFVQRIVRIACSPEPQRAAETFQCVIAARIDRRGLPERQSLRRRELTRRRAEEQPRQDFVLRQIGARSEDELRIRRIPRNRDADRRATGLRCREKVELRREIARKGEIGPRKIEF